MSPHEDGSARSIDEDDSGATVARRLVMRIARWLTLVTLGLIAGCGSEYDGELHVRERRQGIIGGAYDTAHPAVIHYVIMNGATQVGACSGTMVSNVNGHAIVLTAAHCF